MSFCKGCHLVLFILTGESGQKNTAKDGASFFHQCLQLYTKAHHCRRAGLEDSYLAVVHGSDLLNRTVSGKAVEQSGFCEWHKLSPWQPVSTSTQPSLLASPSHKSDVLDLLLQAIETCNKHWQSFSHHHSANYGTIEVKEVSTHVHLLLDRLPHSSYSLFDVYWVIEDPSSISPPSTAVGLYGALLRLQEWHNAHIELIVPPSLPSQHSHLQPILEWKQALRALLLSSVKEWIPVTNIIWRGPIHVTENKTPKKASHRTISFPGFSLCIDLYNEQPQTPLGLTLTSGDALEGVGLKMDSFHLCHLEVLQIVDMATFPLFWISPLHCQLSLADDGSHVSRSLFQHLLSNYSGRSVGIIMCLCSQAQTSSRCVSTANGNVKTVQTDSSGIQTSSTCSQTSNRCKTTCDWVEFVQSVEQGTTIGGLQETVTTPLAAYETGPRLLVTPTSSVCDNQSHLGEWSCDAWLLWKPEAINASVFTRIKSQQMEIANDEDGDTIISSLTKSCPNQGNLVNEQLLEEFWKRLKLVPSELDTPPSDWPELEALKTYEWIQRKMIRRVATTDLMFGQMLAPPPRAVTSQVDSFQIGDVLNCFTDQGAPAVTNLSPIAMRGSRLTKVHVPDPNLSFQTVIASTPTSKKQYHGVNYCLTDEDVSIDAKLIKIQQRYLYSERVSHCNTVATPKAQRARQQARRMKSEPVSLSSQQDKEKEPGPDVLILNPKSDSTEYKSGLSVQQSCSSVKRIPRKKLSSQSKQRFCGQKVLKSPLLKISKVQQKLVTDSVQKKQLQSKTENCPPVSLLAQGTTHLHSVIVPLSSIIETKTTAAGTNGVQTPIIETTVRAKGVQTQSIETTVGAKGGQPPIIETTIRARGLQTNNDVHESHTEQREEHVCGIKEETEIHSSPPNTDSVQKTLRRSPRIDQISMTERTATKANTEKTSQRKRKESLKAQLGVQVVAALKNENMPRSHPCFRNCFSRLFNISKSFLKDLDVKGVVMKQEMNQVVVHNASQVVAFELRHYQVGKQSAASSGPS